jgi:hypothetical protein
MGNEVMREVRRSRQEKVSILHKKKIAKCAR